MQHLSLLAGPSHTSCQEFSGDVGSSLATQIGRFDVENLRSKSPEIYHDFQKFSGKNPGIYRDFQKFPGENPGIYHDFQKLSGKNPGTYHDLLKFSGENPGIHHEFQMLGLPLTIIWSSRFRNVVVFTFWGSWLSPCGAVLGGL